jgi:electron transport complex protein RnfB
MQKKEKPSLRAVIREAECIGCTKCIKACPVDAILGSGKEMHTVISDECTGCELCVAPCPVDCIDMVEAPLFENRSEQFRRRFEARNARLPKEKQKKLPSSSLSPLHEKKNYIQEALLRVKNKKNRSSAKD